MPLEQAQMDQQHLEDQDRSEPCSARMNPFDDREATTSRKRQKTSRKGGRSVSPETAGGSEVIATSSSPKSTTGVTIPASPRTPPSMPSDQVMESTSSKVTLNLRTARSKRDLRRFSQSPIIHMRDGEDVRTSVETESDALSNIPPIETPSSSPSALSDSPLVEIISIDADSDFETDPPLTIIGGSKNLDEGLDEFPGYRAGETSLQTVNKVIRYLQYDDIDDPECFRGISKWIDRQLKRCAGPIDLHNMYNQDPDVWMKIPDLIHALSRRSRFFGTFLQRSQDGRQALTDMFLNFARLSGRFLVMDIGILEHPVNRSNADFYPEPVSSAYLRGYGSLLRKEDGSNIGRNLETHYNWDWDADVLLIQQSFDQEGGNLDNLSKLVKLQAYFLARNPKLAEHLTEPCLIASRMVAAFAPDRTLRNAVYPRTLGSKAKHILSKGHAFFKSMEMIFEMLLEKYGSNISAEAVTILLATLTEINLNTLLKENPDTDEVLTRFNKLHPEISHTPQLVKGVVYEWKFSILYKLVTSAQMQFRVIGITTLCVDLLHLYAVDKEKYIPEESPLLQHLTSLLLGTDLLDHIIGIGSHPEIISESNNIIGFLLVTKTYNQTHTDRIWQTVVSSQDPRVVSATIRMLHRILHLMDLSQLYHVCTKIYELPLQSFTPAVRDFCCKVIEIIVGKRQTNSEVEIAPEPYDFCIRLVRDSLVPSADGTVQYYDLSTFALHRLKTLVQYGPGIGQRMSIYASCMQDIASASPTSWGSLCLVSIILQRYPEDLSHLIEHHDLIQLIVLKLEESNNRRRGSTASIKSVDYDISPACLDITMLVITNQPQRISADLSERLWNALVSNSSTTSSHRTHAWLILNSALRKTQSNTFLHSCFKFHFPDLPATCFTTGSLEFVKQMIDIWLESLQLNQTEFQGQGLDCLALEQLWRLVLMANPNTIDSAAIKILVSVYVDSDLMLTMHRATARSIHQGLVERCLRQLDSASSALQTFDNRTSASNAGYIENAENKSHRKVEENTIIFTRSLAVLREFLGAHQSKPHFVIPRPLPAFKEAVTGVRGEPVDVKYQSFDGDTITEIRSLKLGRLNTAATLLAGLQEATGFTNYKVYYRGKPLDAAEIDICQSLADLNLSSDSGLLLVHRRDHLEPSTSKPMISLEMEVMKHIDNLWGYLGLKDTVAQDIYHFLIKLPVYDKLTGLLQTESVLYTEVFEKGKPLKSLYAMHTLKLSIVSRSNSTKAKAVSSQRALSLVVSAIVDDQILGSIQNDDMRCQVAISLTDCLVQILRQPDLPTAVDAILGADLFECLLALMNQSRSTDSSTMVAHLTCRVFDAMVETSRCNTKVWKQFSKSLTASLLRQLLLDEQRQQVRKYVVKQVIQSCTNTSSTANVPILEFRNTFWSVIVRLTSIAVQKPDVCEELFTLALALFKDSDDSADLITDLVDEWTTQLLISASQRHASGEIYESPDLVDPVALGFASLIQAGALIAKMSHKELNCALAGSNIFIKILFPDLLSETEMTRDPSPRLPVLHAGTREKLLEAVHLLVRDDEFEFDKVIHHLDDMVPHSTQEESPYAFDLSWSFDRADAIRSSTGYVGLRNLSNTCYLNSLFTQLFMNLPFREFMINLRVSDDDEDQQLLAETRTLFGNMQNSMRKYVDPQQVAGSIQTYDLTKIDVSIQMDVDEFYNLLFDRWEAQLQPAELKKQFKSFYGGQLVHQIKSKECSHVSEREESFSAIQCDIKGKTCLQESLQAYVEGEVMEGENKYKCSTCDRHVDAVKRARLRQIPDNLIFHLKRFDFNLRTLQRSKINDHFSFPELIDMRPYTIDAVENGEDPAQQDEFELVGVLVHSGTAESGHYYSYTRERPSTSRRQTWVEFNDEIVSPWDSSTLESCCFGGPDIRPGGEQGFDKSYSAYMLFYQRTSVLKAQQHAMEVEKLTSPVRRRIPNSIASVIAMDNELTARKYCLYEPAQTVFISRMLNNMRLFNDGTCTAAHSREKNVLQTVLNHLDQVVARTKDLPQFAGLLGLINRTCQSCAECSRDYIDWYSSCTEALRMLLVRNPDAAVRSEIAASILAALKKIKADAVYAYGFEDDMDSMEAPPQVFLHFADSLMRLYESFHINTRAWPEYFGLLSDIANLGLNESALLLDHDFLRKTLLILCADPLLPSDQQYQKMWSNITKRMTTRPVSYEAIINLLYKLLQSCDVSLEPTATAGCRLKDTLDGYAIALTQGERHLLVQQWSRTESSILVEKLLRIDQNDFAVQSIITWLLQWSSNTGDLLDESIYRAILLGIQRSSIAPPAAPFLRAALTYCEYGAASGALCNTVEEVARAASTDNVEGKEFISFFMEIINVAGNNERIARDDIVRAVIDTVGLWAPNLLTSYEASVRESTDTLIRKILLEHEEHISFDDEDDEKAQVILRGVRNLGMACLEFVHDTYIRQRVVAVRATLMKIKIILGECSHYFGDDDGFHDQHDSVETALKKCEVDDLEEETSGWEASDYPSSEADVNELDTGL